MSLMKGFSPVEYGKKRIEAELPKLTLAGWKGGMLKNMLARRREIWNEYGDTGPIQVKVISWFF